MEKELPNGWILSQLKDVGDVVTGNTPPKKNIEHFGGNIPWIKPGDLLDRKIIKYEETLTESGAQIARLLPPYSIMVSCIGNLGKIGIIDKPATTNQQINSVVFNGSIVNPYFGFYYALTLKEWLYENSSATTVSIINKGRFEKAPIPVPPLPEQQRIVAKLDTLFGQIDRIKTSMERIPQLLKDFRQKVLTQAVTGKLTEEWREGRELEEWKNEKLDNISERITVGYVGKMIDQYSDSGIPFLRSQNVRAFRFSDINLLYISAEFNEEIKKSKIYPGDVVIVRSGYPGTTCVIPDTLVEANCSDILICTPKKERLNPHFVSIFMNSDHGKEIVFQGRVGNAQQHFNTKTLKTTIIPLPLLAEQQEIVRRVESLFAKADRIEASYQKLKERIEQLPQALLAKAFRGELVEQLPTDGDARDLLEQIKQAKAGLEKPGKSKKLKVKDEVRMAAEEEVKYGREKI